MKENNYWKQFMTTGKIEDYLLFAGMRRQSGKEGAAEEAGAMGAAGTAEIAKTTKTAGERTYGGSGKYHGNGAAGGAYRGT